MDIVNKIYMIVKVICFSFFTSSDIKKNTYRIQYNSYRMHLRYIYYVCFILYYVFIFIKNHLFILLFKRIRTVDGFLLI